MLTMDFILNDYFLLSSMTIVYLEVNNKVWYEVISLNNEIKVSLRPKVCKELYEMSWAEFLK